MNPGADDLRRDLTSVPTLLCADVDHPVVGDPLDSAVRATRRALAKRFRRFALNVGVNTRKDHGVLGAAAVRQDCATFRRLRGTRREHPGAPLPGSRPAVQSSAMRCARASAPVRFFTPSLA